ncbi:MAG: hypothetical protein U0807_18215 [Candidatus Binatia bacterium]
MAWRSRFLMVVGSVALLAGPLVRDGFAKKAKSRLSATVDGKRLKASPRALVALSSSGSFSVNGQTKVQKGLSRAVTVNCLGNLGVLALPATLTCYGTYTESRKHGSKSWQSNGMELTVESFDGSRTVGTFRGTLDPASAHASDPPVSIEHGSFSLVVTSVGG